jgi:peptide/nickel transport system substrate-binding protein
MQSMYDTITYPTSKGTVVPYLAKSVTPNADYSEWTITLRDGIKFHDGTPLDAAALKLNMDKWKEGILLQFVFSNMGSIDVVDNLTVKVTMKKPWIAFPWYLWTTGRTGIAAPAQINGNCETDLIGTGPFVKKSFDPSTGDVSVVRNKSYWRAGYPKADGINWKVQGDSVQRLNGLQGGQFDVIHTSGGKDMKTAKSFSGVKVTQEPAGYREISQMLINVTRAPFDDANARKALALAQNRAALAAVGNPGGTLANQVVDSKVLGYVKNPGYPTKQNVAQAKKLVKQYKSAHGGKFEFNLQSTFDPTTQALAAEVKRQAAAVGIKVNLPQPVDQAAIINQAIGGQVDSFLWRNYPGADPDTLYVWFHSGSPVNFNKINDPVIDKALDDGRSELDPAARKADYQTFVKQMSSQVYNYWSWYTDWFIATKGVNGVLGPNLPDASGKPGKDKPAVVLAGFHSLLGLTKK